jgi:hypothetical protein
MKIYIPDTASNQEWGEGISGTKTDNNRPNSMAYGHIIATKMDDSVRFGAI